MAEISGLPLIELDEHSWQPGLVPLPALNQSMATALQQHAEDDAARLGWLAAVRDAR